MIHVLFTKFSVFRCSCAKSQDFTKSAAFLPGLM